MSFTSRAIEVISDVESFNVVGTHLLQTSADLQEATGIGSDNDVRAGLEDVLGFPALQSLGHLRFGQVVAARATAAHVAEPNEDRCAGDGDTPSRSIRSQPH